MSVTLSTMSNQFGFKKKHGTDLCIYVLKEVIDRHRSLNGSMFTCFLDASKAFDRVKHSILFQKLIDRGVPGYIVRLLIYWYSNQTMCIRWSGKLSEHFGVTNGVRQGGILSPYLFNIYMDDLTIALNKCNTGCVIGSTTINHLMYADDLVILSPSVSGLSELMQVCGLYGLNHDIKYNSKKSAVLIFKSKFMKNVDVPSFKINGETIQEVDNVKYLGHFISNTLRDDKDILRQCRQLYARGNTLLRKFYMCSTEVKLTLLRTFCSPMYTAQLWWNYTVASIHKLHVAYNNVFRLLLNQPKYCSASTMFVEYHVPDSKAVIRNLVYKFMRRLDASYNKLVIAIINSDIKWQSRIRRHWIKMLYIHNSFC